VAKAYAHFVHRGVGPGKEYTKVLLKQWKQEDAGGV
jgi:hypothetical protein